MNMNELMHDVHRNAVEHGWWDGGRSEAGIRALIVSEWSEALEEARAGRPLVWHEGEKPEGVAVELMDGCIRILDYLGREKADSEALPETMEAAVRRGRRIIEYEALPNATGTAGVFYEPKDLPEDVLVDLLTAKTMDSRGGYGTAAYVLALCVACAWVAAHGCDPEQVIFEKHEYNKTRPYRHGKRF